MLVHPTYNLWFVALSYLVAALGSFAALQLAVAIPLARSSRQRTATVMVAGAAMGLGAIWAMHFIGLLACTTGLPMAYDATLSALSALLAFASCSLGLMLVGDGHFDWVKVIVAGMCVGLGMLGSQFLGLAAMLMPANISYDRHWVEASAALAVIGSIAALWLAFHLRGAMQMASGALVMSGTAFGMHYFTMAAVSIHRNGNQLPEDFANGLRADRLDTAILSVVVALILVLLISHYMHYRRRATITI